MPAPTAKRPPAIHPFTGRDVPWLVDAQAVARGAHPYLIWEPFTGERQVWSYADFATETRAYAAGLAQRGIGPGGFVMIHMENCPEFLFIWHACSRLGAVAVTTNAHSTADELGYFATRSGACAAVTQPKFMDLLLELGHGFRWIATTETDAGQPAAAHPRVEVTPLSQLRGDPDALAVRPADSMAPNSVQFTSGTTSRPKGVVWTQANALWAARTMASVLQLTADDRGLVHFPLFHTNALAYSTLSTLWAGGSAVLTPRFSASRFWDIAVRNCCTWASMSPFPVRALAKDDEPRSHAFRNWPFAENLSTVRERWGIGSTGWYGMTETVAACITGDPGFPGPEGAMGRPRPEYEISIRRDDGSPAACRETGKLFVRGIPGLSLFLEYLDDPEATAAAFDSEGWFDTGDEVVAREDGYVFFVGRSKDMLKVGGENVAALEIEAVIGTVPGVVDCAVVGKPDRMLDEVPVAFVVATTPGTEVEARIAGICEEKLSPFKRPREIRFVDKLPTGLLGKILKRELRALARGEKI
jgi:crotonobetaine/carnitine-CoA ligase